MTKEDLKISLLRKQKEELENKKLKLDEQIQNISNKISRIEHHSNTSNSHRARSYSVEDMTTHLFGKE